MTSILISLKLHESNNYWDLEISDEITLKELLPVLTDELHIGPLPSNSPWVAVTVSHTTPFDTNVSLNKMGIREGETLILSTVSHLSRSPIAQIADERFAPEKHDITPVVGWRPLIADSSLPLSEEIIQPRSTDGFHFDEFDFDA